MARRLHAMGLERYRNGFEVTLQEDALQEPMRWKKPRRIFVNSMSDLFHEKVPLEFIQRVFDVMQACVHHNFQILTKRSARLCTVARKLPWPPNVWMGVSVENQHVIDRINDLVQTPATIKFLSCEPLIGPISTLDLAGIDWVIVGGESGPGARPMKSCWVEDILRQCRRKDVPFFFKQWGGTRKKRTGRTLNGRTYDEYPSCESAEMQREILHTA